MNLVVAYLTKVREHVIIPESYIYGFNLKALKNFGRNACRDQLVYWSDECIEGEHYPDPKKDAVISENWPSETGAWFHARTIYYTDDIEEAKQIKEKRRRVLPGIYNPARLNERPLPVLVLMPEVEQQQTDDENLTAHNSIGETSLNLRYSDDSTDLNIEEYLAANRQQHSDDDRSIANGSIDEQSLNSNDSDNATGSTIEENLVANQQQQSDDQHSVANDSIDEPSMNSNNSANATVLNVEKNLVADQQQQSDDQCAIANDPVGELSVNSNNSDNATASNNDESVVTNQQQQSNEAQQNAQNSLDEMPMISSNLDGVTSTTSNNTQLGNDEQQFENSSNSHSNHEQQQTNGAQSIAQDLSNHASQSENVSTGETDIEPSASASSDSGADTLTTSNMGTSTLNTVKSEPIFAPLVEENAQSVEEIFNGNFENCDESGDVMILSQEVLPIPKGVRNPYEVKQKDLISGNMAFATNTAGDRSYIVMNGIKWKEMTLPIRVVKGLKSFNMEGFRQSAEYDRKFVKILLSTCNGINKVKLGILDPFAVNFIKELYRVRCEDEDRIKNLDELIKTCCDELAERFK